MRRIVENMGLAWQRQIEKLKEQEAKFACYHMVTRDTLGREQTMLCMPVDKLPLWLATINPNKIRDAAIRAKVEEYRAESAIVVQGDRTDGPQLGPKSRHIQLSQINDDGGSHDLRFDAKRFHILNYL